MHEHTFVDKVLKSLVKKRDLEVYCQITKIKSNAIIHRAAIKANKMIYYSSLDTSQQYEWAEMDSAENTI